VTVTIAPPARGHVVISNPYAPAGVAAATYRPCAHVAGFYAQGFAFTDGQIRGCVPLEVTIGGQQQVRHVTLSRFAGSCSGEPGHDAAAGQPDGTGTTDATGVGVPVVVLEAARRNNAATAAITSAAIPIQPRTIPMVARLDPRW